jgi:hypothetical protein
VVDSNVDKMLSAGVIEAGNRAWGFPVVLVKKYMVGCGFA